MIISILGCGWYGKALGTSLIDKGFTVNGSVTSANKFSELSNLKIKPYLVNLSSHIENNNADFFEADVLIICIPPKFRQGEADIYLDKIKNLIGVIGESQVKKVIYISSTKVYGDCNRIVSELDSSLPDEKEGRILLAAEQLFETESIFDTTIIRFGGLVGPGRHPGKFFAGKTNVPNGQCPVNLVHLDDCIGITEAVIEKDAFGFVFNAVLPSHPTKTDFYTATTLQAGLPAPSFIDELNEWKIVYSVSVQNQLQYDFKIASWAGFQF